MLYVVCLEGHSILLLSYPISSGSFGSQPRSSSILNNNNNIIAQHHHTNNPTSSTSIHLQFYNSAILQFCNTGTECAIALRLSTINRPEGAAAIADLHLPGSEIIPGTSGTGSIEELLVEANDMSFGR